MQVESVTMLLAERAAPLRGPPGWEPGETLLAQVVETPAPGVVRLQAGGHIYEARPGFDLKPGTEARVRVFRRGGAVRLEVQAPEEAVRANAAGRAARLMLTAQQPLGRLTARIALLTGRRDVPPALLGALRRVAAHMATPERLRDPRALAALIKRAGVWLESRLAAAVVGSRAAAPAPGSDLKAALMQLAAALETLSAGPAAAGPREPGRPGAEPAAPPLPYRLPSAERHASPGAGADTGEVVRQLHHDVHAALARVGMHQLAALNADAALPFWSLEIPVMRRDGAETIGLTIEREGESGSETAGTAYTVTVAMEPAGLGPVWARLTWRRGGHLAGTFYAGDSRGRQRLSIALPQLRERLAGCGLNPGTLACRAGTPPLGDKPPPRHMLDVRA